MKIKIKEFSKLNPHVCGRILNIISERISYGWDFRVLYPEFYHENIKLESPIFKKANQELLFDFFTRMLALSPLSIDEFIILSTSLEKNNGISMDKCIEIYSDLSLEIQLHWNTKIIQLLVDICLTDCTFMANSYNKAVVEYCKNELNVINYLYLAKYNIG